MRQILIACGIAAVAVLAGTASAGVRDVLMSNTLILTDSAESDHQTAYLLDPNGGFTATTSTGASVAGGWTLKDGRLCLTPQGSSTACVPMGDDRAVGLAWYINGPTGQPVTHAEIVAGRQKIGDRNLGNAG